MNKIDVRLKAEVINATTKKIEKFEESHTFSVHANERAKDKHMTMPYLRIINGEYECIFLGRNGESSG